MSERVGLKSSVLAWGVSHVEMKEMLSLMHMLDPIENGMQPSTD
jgi:hypothetical protein